MSFNVAGNNKTYVGLHVHRPISSCIAPDIFMYSARYLHLQCPISSFTVPDIFMYSARYLHEQCPISSCTVPDIFMYSARYLHIQRPISSCTVPDIFMYSARYLHEQCPISSCTAPDIFTRQQNLELANSFIKFLNIKSQGNTFIVSYNDTCGQTDGHDRGNNRFSRLI